MAGRKVGLSKAGKKLRPLQEAPDVHDMLYQDPDTVGIILRRLIHMEGEHRKLSERFNSLDKRLLRLEDHE